MSLSSPDITAAKQDLRETALQLRAGLRATADDEDCIASQLLNLRQNWAGHIVAGYWPIRGEFSPLAAMLAVSGQGAQLALPVVDKDAHHMIFGVWGGGALMDGPYGTKQPPEPVTACIPDIILCPLLAFDRRGNRLGYGGGYYDAAIKAARQAKNAKVYGVAFGEQAVLFPLPIESFDEKMDAVITPERIIPFE
ncbi:MAG: 5-formyltetrahydrofolate cyclo-ligase [Pseudomonadota bacterium]